MMTDLLWRVATATPALLLDVAVFAVAAAIGFLPLVYLLPFIGAWVPVARLAAVLPALTIAFLTGFRIADEREVLAQLRAALAAAQADRVAAERANADEARRTREIEEASHARHQLDADYIASLQARAACALDDDDLVALRGLRPGRAGRAGP